MIEAPGPDRIVAEGVSIRYGDRVALQRTDLVIEAGTIHGIIGPAGGGKTSFLRTLNLMSVELDGAHADGSIRIGDDEILSDPQVRRDPATLSQLRRRVGRQSLRQITFLNQHDAACADGDAGQQQHQPAGQPALARASIRVVGDGLEVSEHGKTNFGPAARLQRRAGLTPCAGCGLAAASTLQW